MLVNELYKTKESVVLCSIQDSSLRTSCESKDFSYSHKQVTVKESTGLNRSDNTYVHSSFLWSRTDFIAIFNEASILVLTINTTLGTLVFGVLNIKTYRFLLFCSSGFNQRVMIFTDM